MLNEVSSIDNLVVIVDDLDRCSPDRIVDTLEAIKLFLSVKKTTFIVAVDQRIIEYAVNVKYPQVNGFEVSADYIEKIIQLPIKIPELSPKDIENYLLLLVAQRVSILLHLVLNERWLTNSLVIPASLKTFIKLYRARIHVTVDGKVELDLKTVVIATLALFVNHR